MKKGSGKGVSDKDALKEWMVKVGKPQLLEDLARDGKKLEDVIDKDKLASSNGN